jgi:hypothetical protein
MAENKSALPDEAEFETKSTKDTLIGYQPSPVPHVSRTGSQLSEDEVKHSQTVVGSPAQGNGISNPDLRSVGELTAESGGGVSTESGGTQDKPALSTRSTRRERTES